MEKRVITSEVPDFSGHPDLVVMLLGMRVRSLRGLRLLWRAGDWVRDAVASKPDGLLHARNNLVYGWWPPHMMLIWYWRDKASLEAWTRSDPHSGWWADYLRDPAGTGIWHESFHMRGGMEAIYGEMEERVGFGTFLPMMPSRGSMGSRLNRRASADLDALPKEHWPDMPIGS
jgi:hypothetical protein